MNKDSFLTTKWNNILSLVLGLPALAYVIVILTTTMMSDISSFAWLLGIGVVY